ncbi:MAG: thioredoxin family protein [Polyangiaceae bacterium]
MNAVEPGRTNVAQTSVIEVDDASFEREVLAAELPVLVEFGAPWCGPCRALAPLVERLAAEHAGRLKVVTVDTDASPRTAARYGVRAVPMVIVFRGGQKAGAHLGMTTRQRLLELIVGAPAA